jgi:hypothetical protein
MKENTDRMDKAIKEKFDQHETRVPSELWNSIQSKLPPEDTSKGFIYFLSNPFIIVAMFVSLVSVTTGIYYFSDLNTEQPNRISSVQNNSFNTNQSSKGQQAIETESKNGSAHQSVSGNKEILANKEDSKNIVKPGDATKNTNNTLTGQKQQRENTYNNKTKSTQRATFSGDATNKEQKTNGSLLVATSNKKPFNKIQSTSNNQTKEFVNHQTNDAYSNQMNMYASVTGNTTENLRINSNSENSTTTENQRHLVLNKNTNTAFTNTTISDSSTSHTSNNIIKEKSNLIAASTNLSDDISRQNTTSINTEKTGIDGTSVKTAYSSIQDTTENMSSVKNSLQHIDAITTNTAITNTMRTAVFDSISYIDSISKITIIDSAAIKNATTDAAAKTVEDQKPSFLSYCSIDAYVSPALGYMNLQPQGSQETINSFIKDRNRNTSAGTSVSAGIRMNYALSRKIEIGIGIQYSATRQSGSLTTQNLDSIFYKYQGYTSLDSVYDPQTQQVVFKQVFVKTDSTLTSAYSNKAKRYTDKYQNFSIPVYIAYGYSVTDRFSIIARSSLLINYSIYSITYLNESEEQVLSYHSQKKMSLGGSVSIGAYYAFSRKYSVFAEPVFTYYFSNMFEKQAPFKQHLMTIGLQTGIRLNF